MKLFQHQALGGAIVITNAPRYEATPGYTKPTAGHTIATFVDDEDGRFAYACFKSGLTIKSTSRYPNSLFNEETGEYVVGSVDQLDTPATA